MSAVSVEWDWCEKRMSGFQEHVLLTAVFTPIIRQKCNPRHGQSSVFKMNYTFPHYVFKRLNSKLYSEWSHLLSSGNVKLPFCGIFSSLIISKGVFGIPKRITIVHIQSFCFVKYCKRVHQRLWRCWDSKPQTWPQLPCWTRNSPPGSPLPSDPRSFPSKTKRSTSLELVGFKF